MISLFRKAVLQVAKRDFPISLLAKSYNSISMNYGEYFQQRMLETYEDVFSWYDYYSRNDIKVLDLGCGNGFFGNLLIQKNPQIKYTGIELSSGLLSGRHKYFSNKLNSSFIEGDYVEKIKSFPEQSFDCVVSLWSQKFNNPVDFFPQVFRILKKGGFFVLLTEQKNSDSEFMECVDSFLQKRSAQFTVLPPLPYLPETGKELNNLLASSNFEKTIVWEKNQKLLLSSPLEFIEQGRYSGLLAGWDQIVDFYYYDFRDEILPEIKSKKEFTITKKYIGAIARKGT